MQTHTLYLVKKIAWRGWIRTLSRLRRRHAIPT
jgi:hypothetical protein